MRSTWIALILAICGASCVNAIDLTPYPYYKDIHDRVPSGSFVSSDFDDHIFKYTHLDYSNVVLVDSLDAPVPFIIRPKQNRNVQFYDVPVLAEKKSSRLLKNGGFEVIYHKQRQSVDPNKIIMTLTPDKYEAGVSIWGSSDAVQWKELAKDVLVYKYLSPILSSNDEIVIDSRDIAYFKIRVEPIESEESPYRILAKQQDGLPDIGGLKRVAFVETKSKISVNVPVQREYEFSQKRHRVQENNSQFILSSGRQPVNSIVIHSSNPFFARPIHIQGRIGHEDWKSIFSGRISQVSYEGKRYSTTECKLDAQVRFDDYLVVIGNGANDSLDIDRVSAKGHTIEVAYFVSGKSPFRLYYGSKKSIGGTGAQNGASSSKTGELGAISNLKEVDLPEVKVVQDLSSEKLNPSFSGRHELSLQYVMRQKGFLIFILGSVCIVLILFWRNRFKK